MGMEGKLITTTLSLVNKTLTENKSSNTRKGSKKKRPKQAVAVF